ncbi:sulfite exporter TauE/SafE family protein [Cupriavidus sp. DL-D2]|uniref:sulfite exporter TauE/SafE family protein n=1 Tax=Cupriavidus sp. DL-D2 TaxID=3144974 RepID=UPI0032151655
MQGTTATLLFAAGVAGGLVNALAGGATLITFPAMLTAGLPAIIANASNAVAISPGHLIAALADREKLPAMTGRAMTCIAVAVLGGLIGAVVLTQLPERLFTIPIPALIAAATLLFALSPGINRWVANRPDAGRMLAGGPGAVLLGVVCVYGGFFGAGLGVILTAMLTVTEPGDLRAVKALKNLMATCVSLSATLIFIAQGAVRWPETLTMLAGALAGGYGGGMLVRVLPSHRVRQFVIVAGALMSLIYARRYWW